MSLKQKRLQLKVKG